MDIQKHQRTKRILKVVGILVLIAGIALDAVGFVSFFSAIGASGRPKYFWCSFIGMPLTVLGIAMLVFGFRREITSYVAEESAPVFNRISQAVTPGVKTIAEAVRGEEIACPKCGMQNADHAKFCKGCGETLRKVCPACGETNDADGTFCNHCGAKL